LQEDKQQYFPICLQVAGKPCIVIGGGRVGERKVQGLVAHGARVTVISPELTPALSAQHRDGQVGWLARSYREGDLAGAFLVIAATDDPVVQQQVHAEAEKNNTLLNVADVPKWCNFILPATARQGDLAVSISTAGKSPALARKLRQELEKQFGPEFAVLVNILGALRDVVMSGPVRRTHEENKVIFGRLAEIELAVWIRNGDWERIARHIQEVLGSGVPLDCIEVAREEYKRLSGAAK